MDNWSRVFYWLILKWSLKQMLKEETHCDFRQMVKSQYRIVRRNEVLRKVFKFYFLVDAVKEVDILVDFFFFEVI